MEFAPRFLLRKEREGNWLGQRKKERETHTQTLIDRQTDRDMSDKEASKKKTRGVEKTSDG